MSGLTGGASGHDGLVATASGITALLSGSTVAAGSLGAMDAATAFVAELSRVADELGRLAGREVEVRDRQSVATSTTARLGELLKSDLKDMASAATPPPLSTPGAILLP